MTGDQRLTSHEEARSSGGELLMTALQVADAARSAWTSKKVELADLKQGQEVRRRLEAHELIEQHLRDDLGIAREAFHWEVSPRGRDVARIGEWLFLVALDRNPPTLMAGVCCELCGKEIHSGVASSLVRLGELMETLPAAKAQHAPECPGATRSQDA